jgi:hypothetical protein
MTRVIYLCCPVSGLDHLYMAGSTLIWPRPVAHLYGRQYLYVKPEKRTRLLITLACRIKRQLAAVIDPKFSVKIADVILDSALRDIKYP